MALTLIIGNKNYSSWSMRPWLAMTAAGIPFEEEVVWLDTPEFSARLAGISPAGRVPVLIDGDAVVWETLAILEHLAERFPDSGLWPQEKVARAHARAQAAEMHAGFTGLRRDAPMNLWRPVEPLALSERGMKDLADITKGWRTARERFGAGGDFLFGAFSAADAMYAPVASRIRTYALPVDPVSAAYVEAIHAHPAFRAWHDAALKETRTVEADEVDWPVVKRV
ncbi:glutathione S-transferase family protein [Ancylobacter sp. 6x-1]|uniref:Glutathione S-transferase family protein n=1 Tax=Ancylobacter crimeensis TaxID=2579147 RepID=A0ABT0DC86_9HYPH|nr:glutathione S-transferase family protein [Ancylobacter crimeensis]MCK0197573.1 glutathione S-transferase family protein [Ancylobacter crimeensis]